MPAPRHCEHPSKSPIDRWARDPGCVSLFFCHPLSSSQSFLVKAISRPSTLQQSFVRSSEGWSSLKDFALPMPAGTQPLAIIIIFYNPANTTASIALCSPSRSSNNEYQYCCRIECARQPGGGVRSAKEEEDRNMTDPPATNNDNVIGALHGENGMICG